MFTDVGVFPLCLQMWEFCFVCLQMWEFFLFALLMFVDTVIFMLMSVCYSYKPNSLYTPLSEDVEMIATYDEDTDTSGVDKKNEEKAENIPLSSSKIAVTVGGN